MRLAPHAPRRQWGKRSQPVSGSSSADGDHDRNERWLWHLLLVRIPAHKQPTAHAYDAPTMARFGRFAAMNSCVPLPFLLQLSLPLRNVSLHHCHGRGCDKGGPLPRLRCLAWLDAKRVRRSHWGPNLLCEPAHPPRWPLPCRRFHLWCAGIMCRSCRDRGCCCCC